MSAILYEHSDGRRRVALSAESATFTPGDPSWYRAGPVELPPECEAAPDLLSELKAAHKIIRNALNLMTTTQKAEWARRNESDGVIGEGTTRANEREAVIAAAGSPSHG